MPTVYKTSPIVHFRCSTVNSLRKFSLLHVDAMAGTVMPIESPKGFLDIPMEIRVQIYRYLLRQNESIDIYQLLRLGDEPNRVRLQPCILRSCRKVSSEALPVLYGENTWNVVINNTLEDPFKDQSNHRLCFFRDNHLLQRLRRLDIRIMVSVMGSIHCFRWDVTDVCRVLANLVQINYLRISCEMCCCCQEPTDQPDWKPGDLRLNILQTYFGELRNIRSVVIEGIPTECAEKMKQLMTGDQPSDRLRIMYETLEEFAHDLPDFEPDLSKAREAMERGDVREFRRRRSHMATTTRRYMIALTKKLCQNDFDWEDSDQSSDEGQSSDDDRSSDGDQHSNDDQSLNDKA